MCDFLTLANPGVRGLRPYEPGKPVDELERELGIREAVKLASNENPLGPSPKALDAVRALLPKLALYPDGNGFRLKAALAARHALPMERITLGNGSNEILELILRAFAGPEHEILFSRHAFIVYQLVTQAIGATPVAAPAKQYAHDLEAMHARISERTRVIFVTNPNNPTGTWLGADALRGFIERVPKNVLVVVDEAYFEYASDPRINAGLGETAYPDTLRWLDDFSNLIVTRTFSKAYGLAGLRIGWAAAHEQVTDLLNRVRQPFNVNAAALAAAEAALGDEEFIEQSRRVNREGMTQLQSGFDELGLAWIPSLGNFISVDLGRSGDEVYQAMLREGVIARPVGNYEMPNHLRITIGTREQNSRFLAALEKILTGGGDAGDSHG